MRLLAFFWHGQRWMERKDATSVCLQQHRSIFLCSDNCADGLLSFIPAVEGRTRCRAGPVLMWRRCPFTANWLLCAHHLVISSDWLMVKPPLVIQVSQACVPVIKICHPEPHPSSPLNPSVRWQSSDNAPNSYFSDRTIAHLCQAENKHATFLQDYVKLVC